MQYFCKMEHLENESPVRFTHKVDEAGNYVILDLGKKFAEVYAPGWDVEQICTLLNRHGVFIGEVFC